MISFIIKKIVGSQNEREIKRFTGIVETINSYEETMVKMPSADLRNKTQEFIEKLEKEVGLDGDFRDDKYFQQLEAVVEEILPEAYALVREAGRRTRQTR